MRPQLQARRGARFIPHPVFITGDHLESVQARRNVVTEITAVAKFGFLPLVLSASGPFYILWAVSICLILYGVYLYANDSRQDSNS